MSYETVRDKLARGETVLLDGGVGTEVLRRGVYWRSHGIERQPEAVRQVHADYVAAGADRLRSHTLQLNPPAYLNLLPSPDNRPPIRTQVLEHWAKPPVRA